jgi:hypothetical protein
MAAEEIPTLNAWYETDEGTVFQVTAIDADRSTIETRFLDGTFDELGMDAWSDLSVKEVLPPEDWQGNLGESAKDWKDFWK